MQALLAPVSLTPARTPYVGRFAPSPTGPLHPGSMVAALASWLDARAHRGRWLVRIEDVDTPRCVPDAAEFILGQLSAVGLLPDEEPVWQSSRGLLYEAALSQLLDAGRAYPCACSRRDIEQALAALGAPRTRHGELIYPGTCRPESGGLAGRPARAIRCRTTAIRENRTDTAADVVIAWTDRRLGPQSQDLTHAVGDFVLKRADGLWAYQLAVVVDDAAQGVSSVVRGEDLADNTGRQIHLQRLLGLPLPNYLHTPLVLAADGQKLSKQNGAEAVDTRDPAQTLHEAARLLGIVLPDHGTVASLLENAVAQWRGACKLA